MDDPVIGCDKKGWNSHQFNSVIVWRFNALSRSLDQATSWEFWPFEKGQLKKHLSDRSQCVLWNSILSNYLPLNKGVPQGSILGPILFLVMIHDTPKCFTRNTGSTSSKVVGYADDTTVYVKGKNPEHLRMELQSLGRMMVDYCDENGLVLNGQKTQLLTSARKKLRSILIRM